MGSGKRSEDNHDEDSTFAYYMAEEDCSSTCFSGTSVQGYVHIHVYRLSM